MNGATTNTVAFLEVRARWAQRHDWASGARLKQRAPGSSFWLMLEGAVQVRNPADDAQEWRIEAGQAFLWPSGCDRDIFTPQGASWLTVGLEAVAFGRDAMRLLHPPALWRPEPAQQLLLQTLLEQLVQAHHDEPSGAALLMSQGLTRALFGLCWQMRRDDDLNAALQSSAPHWLERALRLLEREPLPTVGELAREVGLSPAQFRRSFRAWMNQSPREHLQSQRLERARLLLQTTAEPVAQVAARSGFSNASHFTRQFKRAQGISPAAYRRAVSQRI